MELLIWREQMLHPEIREAFNEASRRDTELLEASGSALVMRELFVDLEEAGQLKLMFKRHPGIAEGIAGVIVLPLPGDRLPPVRVPLNEAEVNKWAIICKLYQEQSRNQLQDF